MTMATNTDTPIRARVTKPCSHRSKMPMTITPAAPITPATLPRVHHRPSPVRGG